MNKTRLLFFCFSTLFFANCAFATCIDKVCFSKQVRLENEEISLLGAYKFSYLFFDVYTIALYGPNDVDSSEKILRDVPKQLVFHYHRNIEREKMIEGARENLKSNPNINPLTFTSELDTLNKNYTDVKEGDRYTLSYSPNQGLSLLLNGNKLVTIPGAEFAKTYFGIWLSKYPLSEDLRDGLFAGI